MKDFQVFADGLDVKFICPNCHRTVTYRISNIPSPDWAGETCADSENSDDELFNCINCGRSFCADIFVNISEGNVIVTDNQTNKEVTPIELIELYLEEQDL